MNKKILSQTLVLVMIFSLVIPVTVAAEPTGIYIVSYDANGGSGAPTSQNKSHNVSLTLSRTQPTRTGHDFMGWATKKAATNPEYHPGGAYHGNGNITLCAVWKVKPAPMPTVKPILPPTPTVKPTPPPTVKPTPPPTVKPTLPPTVKPTPPPVVKPTPAPCTPIKINQIIKVVSVTKTACKYYSFTPTVSGNYVVTSTGSTGAANLDLFNANWVGLGF